MRYEIDSYLTMPSDDDERVLARHELAHLLQRARDMAQAKTPGAADTVRVGTPPANVGADVTTIAGTVPVKSENLSSADQETVTGDGSTYRPLQGAGGPGGVVTDDDTIQGDGSVGDPVALKKVYTDDDTIQGDGTSGDAIALKMVYTDETITGLGTQASPLHAIGAGEGVNVRADGAPVVEPAVTLDFITEAAAPIGLTPTDAGGGVAEIRATLSGDNQNNEPGNPAVQIDLTKWIVGLINDGAPETVADFELPTNPSGVLEITLVQLNEGSTQVVRVAVADFVGGSATFTSAGQRTSITFISFLGVWFLKANNGFVQS